MVIVKVLVKNIAHKNVIKGLQWTLFQLIDGWISFTVKSVISKIEVGNHPLGSSILFYHIEMTVR